MKRRILVAGASGMVGRALVRRLGDDVMQPSRKDLDLCDGTAVDRWFDANDPHELYMAAAYVGGIRANATRPVQFLECNLAIQANLIRAAVRHDCRTVFFGSSCVYPKHAPQPIPESALMTGPLEETNRAYAIAKIAGIEMISAYRQQRGLIATCLMPCNLYGPNDRFGDEERSHVIPGLISRISRAMRDGLASIEAWGTGAALREFLHVDDLAEAAVMAMEALGKESPLLMNVGSGREISIADLARLIAGIARFSGGVCFDGTSPDGTPRKLLDSSQIRSMGWTPRIDLEDGIRSVYGAMEAR